MKQRAEGAVSLVQFALMSKLNLIYWLIQGAASVSSLTLARTHCALLVFNQSYVFFCLHTFPRIGIVMCCAILIEKYGSWIKSKWRKRKVLVFTICEARARAKSFFARIARGKNSIVLSFSPKKHTHTHMLLKNNTRPFFRMVTMKYSLQSECYHIAR